MSEQKENKKVKTIELSTKQKQFLKGLAHSLSPLVQIGKEGVTAGIIEATKKELQHHELIKVKIGSNSSSEKGETSLAIAESTESAMVQLIGKTIVLYKANPKRAKDLRISLPKK